MGALSDCPGQARAPHIGAADGKDRSCAGCLEGAPAAAAAGRCQREGGPSPKLRHEGRSGAPGGGPAAEPRRLTEDRGPGTQQAAPAPGCAAGAAAEEGARVRVHTLWVGPTLPPWVLQCVESYLRTGHIVAFWAFFREERQGDVPALKALCRQYPRHLETCEASAVAPYAAAARMYFHGMGPEGRWRGWAPFSDWFRYSVIASYGGWWVDADGVSARSLRGLVAAGGEAAGGTAAGGRRLVVCTERHRLDRRTVGAVAVARPRGGCRSEEAELHGAGRQLRAGDFAPPGLHEGPGTEGFWAWARRARQAGLEVGLVTNSHFYAPRNMPEMHALADEMRGLLEGYAQGVAARGPAAAQELDANGQLRGGLKSGNMGMLLFQRCVRRLMSSPDASARPCVLHWSVFNPVGATEAQRMHRVLRGAETLHGEQVRSVHIFRQIRDEWGRLGLNMPSALALNISDEPPSPEEEPKPPPGCTVPGAPAALSVLELPRPPGPLLKRRRGQP